MDLGVDAVVALAPVLVLAIVALLGFAGCGFTGQLGPPSLYFRARVPTALTVTRVVFGWEAPSTPRDLKILEGDELKPYVDVEDNVFSHSIPLPLTEEKTPLAETWNVRCQVAVQGGATPGPSDSGMVTLDGSSSYPTATFQATGAAADLTVTFVGVS